MQIYISRNSKPIEGFKQKKSSSQNSKGSWKGGQSIVAYEFNVSRDIIRKGMHELESGFEIVDAHNAKGRKKIERKMPKLMDDIKDIVDSQSQTDPNFKTTRLFTRLTVK